MPNPLLVGINYPWVDYGWDFGTPPLAWTGGNVAEWRARKRERIAADMISLATLGLFAVRWFILADGMTCGMGREAPQRDDERWDFRPLPPGHPFYAQLADDFEFVLKTLNELNLKFVPSLIDFHWCLPGTNIDPSLNLIKGGRADIVCDETKRAQFFDLVLEPLLDISLRYPDTIYAWELINEPEWVTKKKPRFVFSDKDNDPHHTVSYRTMREFLTEGLARINHKKLADDRSAFQSTIGLAHWHTIAEWDANELGATLQQFHYYAQDGAALPPGNVAGDVPCFVGEFASTTELLWPELQQEGLSQNLSSRLGRIAERGFHSAFLWSANATDPATCWTQAEQHDTLAYLRDSSSTSDLA